MKLNERINQLIENRGVSAYEVSKDTGISQSSLSRILGGHTKRISRQAAELLARYFHVNEEWLRLGIGQSELREPVSPGAGGDPMDQSPALTSEVDYLREICRLKDEIIRLQQENKVLSVEIAEIKVGFTTRGDGSAPNASVRTA
jgi:transcriptional regulator with XRE-family HTH domain